MQHRARVPHRDPADPPRRRANRRRGHGTFANDRPPIAGVVGRDSGAFRSEVMDTVIVVVQAYLNMIYARRRVDVVYESLFLARDQSRITQIRIDVGASAPLDILQPRVTIATSEELLITSVADVRRAEDRLRALLNLPESEWDRPIIPTDPVDYEPSPDSTATALPNSSLNRSSSSSLRFPNSSGGS